MIINNHNLKIALVAFVAALGLFVFSTCHAQTKDEYTDLTHLQISLKNRQEQNSQKQEEIKLGQIWLKEERSLDSNGNLTTDKVYYQILKDYGQDWGVCFKRDLGEHFCAWLLEDKSFLPGYFERNNFKRIK